MPDSLIPPVSEIQSRLDRNERERRQLRKLLKIAQENEGVDDEESVRRTKTGTQGLTT